MNWENRNLGMDMEIEGLGFENLDFDLKMGDYLDSSLANIIFLELRSVNNKGLGIGIYREEKYYR